MTDAAEKKWSPYRCFASGIFILAAAVLSGCPKNAAIPATQPAIVQVTVSKPIVREVTDYFEFPGQTEAVNEVAIRARVTGYIDKVNFEDGQHVKKREVLFEIDPRPYRAILDHDRGELARLSAQLEKAKVDLARSERLRPSGAVSQDEYEQRIAQLKIVQAWYASAKANVDKAELDLEFTKVLSPINGRVSRARIKEGNLVQSGNSEAAVLTTVVTTHPIYVYFNMDEHSLLRYSKLPLPSGQTFRPSRLKDMKLPVEIGLADEEGYPHRGLLDFVDNKLDRDTGTLQVRALFENENEFLTPGLFVRVRVPFGAPHQALLIDEQAIFMDQKHKCVKTVGADNIVQYRPVKLGPRQNGLRIVESGIGPDDRVIVKGVQFARTGEQVAVKKDSHP
jgi:RND family efflux transporter MFP subunit